LSTLSTHVLDTSLGAPAAGIAIRLQHDGTSELLGRTDSDGRARHATPLQPGEYQLLFSVGEYFAATGRTTFYREIVVQFEITDPTQHLHLPLLVSPFGYTTYRGS
jgi:5-hydroxyisourate hydrolase